MNASILVFDNNAHLVLDFKQPEPTRVLGGNIIEAIDPQQNRPTNPHSLIRGRVAISYEDVDGDAAFVRIGTQVPGENLVVNGHNNKIDITAQVANSVVTGHNNKVFSS